ncbi:MAG: VWA domain-containing protein [Treponema sp.]|nr:VWA domain-containing protein [Treponema sp.]
MNKKTVVVTFLLFLCIYNPAIYSQDLTINREDVLIEHRPEGGFHLFIRKKPAIGSVLLTESTRDPGQSADNYAYRAGEWNEVNGDEIRLLNGVPITRESRIYSLVSSTVVNHSVMGPAFHVYIPYMLYYGYEGGRHGEVYVTDGTYFNIRAFSLPYADYRGAFRDNPFIMEATQEPPGPPDGNYMKEAVEAFGEIAVSGSGDLIYSTGSDDLIDRIRGALEKEKGNELDLVICLDTTGSMRPHIDPVRQKLIPMLNELLADFSSFRIGMVLYKDYNDEYMNRVVPFTSDFNLFQRNLNAIRVGGGGDIPEAVYEALNEGAIKFPWAAESRVMFLIGDAPPHPRPRGRITREIVDKAVEERNIKVHAIILPN